MFLASNPRKRLRESVRLGRVNLDGLATQEAAEFRTYQYLVRARRFQIPEHGLTSIVIVNFNQLECTRQCLDSIRRLTDEPYEIIVVDNGSTDGSAEFLSALNGIRLIANNANRGYPPAANQGIAIARGDQVLLLNNDTIVTTGWLTRMLLRPGERRLDRPGRPLFQLGERAAANSHRLRAARRPRRLCVGLGQGTRWPACGGNPAGGFLFVSQARSSTRSDTSMSSSAWGATTTMIIACAPSRLDFAP